MLRSKIISSTLSQRSSRYMLTKRKRCGHKSSMKYGTLSLTTRNQKLFQIRRIIIPVGYFGTTVCAALCPLDLAPSARQAGRIAVHIAITPCPSVCLSVSVTRSLGPTHKRQREEQKSDIFVNKRAQRRDDPNLVLVRLVISNSLTIAVNSGDTLTLHPVIN